MKYAWAVPGAKVVCVQSFARSMDHGEQCPSIGDKLTIRTVEADEDDVFLTFEEIINPPVYGGDECDFVASGFRPVIDQSTDIAMFKAIAERGLRQNSIHVSEPA